MVYYTTYVVHTKIFFWDFDNDSYAQNSEIILTIRIQKNFFKIPIGKFFENCQNPKKKYLCVPHMWYTIPHLWVKVTTYVDNYTFLLLKKTYSKRYIFNHYPCTSCIWTLKCVQIRKKCVQIWQKCVRI